MPIGLFLLKKYEPKSSDNYQSEALLDILKQQGFSAFEFRGNQFYDHDDVVWDIVHNFTLHYEVNRDYNLQKKNLSLGTIFPRNMFDKKMLKVKIPREIDFLWTNFLWG